MFAKPVLVAVSQAHPKQGRPVSVTCEIPAGYFPRTWDLALVILADAMRDMASRFRRLLIG